MSLASPTYRAWSQVKATASPRASADVAVVASGPVVSGGPGSLVGTTTASPLFTVLRNRETEVATASPGEDFSRESLAEFRSLRATWRADAMLDRLGMFLLHTIVGVDGGVRLDSVAENLQGSAGWIAIARLVRAGLLDENGRTLYATPAGRRAAELTRGLVVDEE